MMTDHTKRDYSHENDTAPTNPSTILCRFLRGAEGMIEQVATQVVSKYLKKGNMARCLRDILPSSGLSKEQRETVAEIVHRVVRWKKLYEHILDSRGATPTPRLLVMLAKEGAEAEAASYPFEYRYSCSPYVADVLKEYGEWARYLNEQPPTTLCVNRNTSTPEQVMSLLQEDHLFAERALLDTAILTSSLSKYSRVLQQRYAHVQDESSQLVAFLACSLGESVLDFCAGSGGKSLAMASISRNGKRLSAYDTNAAKRAILEERCHDYGAKVKVKDTVPKTVFEVVLVDAPCTGLGAARRNPEAKYVEGSAGFPVLQRSILQQAAENVQEQGYLLYSVCTITPEETTQVVEGFVQHANFAVASLTSFQYNKYVQLTKNGAFTVVPRGDLFFLSLLQKQ